MRTALIVAVVAVLVVCIPLTVYTVSAANRESELDENFLGIQPETAEPTGEEEQFSQSAVQDPDGETTDPEGTTDPDDTGNTTETYKKGDSSAEIARMQARLMELGYMTKGDTTEKFGPATETALILFQKVEGLDADGIAGPAVREELFAENTANFALKEGSKNSAVMDLQKKLISLKYLSSEATGYYGTDTVKAVKNFQERNKLTVDGKVGLATWNRLQSSDAVKAGNE